MGRLDLFEEHDGNTVENRVPMTPGAVQSILLCRKGQLIAGAHEILEKPLFHGYLPIPSANRDYGRTKRGWMRRKSLGLIRSVAQIRLR
jgi:hypothetical protein